MNWVITSLSDFNNGLGHILYKILNEEAYVARMLLAFYSPERIYEDDVNCLESVAFKREQILAKTSFYNLMPNPTSGYCWLIHEGLSTGSAAIELISLDGIKIQEYKIGNRFTYIDLSNINTGMYVISLMQGDRLLYNNKLIVVK